MLLRKPRADAAGAREAIHRVQNGVNAAGLQVAEAQGAHGYDIEFHFGSLLTDKHARAEDVDTHATAALFEPLVSIFNELATIKRLIRDAPFMSIRLDQIRPAVIHGHLPDRSRFHCAPRNGFATKVRLGGSATIFILVITTQFLGNLPYSDVH